MIAQGSAGSVAELPTRPVAVQDSDLVFVVHQGPAQATRCVLAVAGRHIAAVVFLLA